MTLKLLVDVVITAVEKELESVANDISFSPDAHTENEHDEHGEKRDYKHFLHN